MQFLSNWQPKDCKDFIDAPKYILKFHIFWLLDNLADASRNSTNTPLKVTVTTLNYQQLNIENIIDDPSLCILMRGIEHLY